jgi:hypothetical protein
LTAKVFLPIIFLAKVLPLNVVIIVRTNLATSHRSHAVLFSTDLDLSYDKIIDYYSLRFQIEFNFRDAKQFWGLEDFMNVSKNAVTNAANLAFFMVSPLGGVGFRPAKVANPKG